MSPPGLRGSSSRWNLSPVTSRSAKYLWLWSPGCFKLILSCRPVAVEVCDEETLGIPQSHLIAIIFSLSNRFNSQFYPLLDSQHQPPFPACKGSRGSVQLQYLAGSRFMVSFPLADFLVNTSGKDSHTMIYCCSVPLYTVIILQIHILSRGSIKESA